MVIFTLMLLGCASQRGMDSPEYYEGQWMAFGNGGGFTGIETKYILKEGKVWGVGADGEEFAVKDIDEDTWKQIFSNAKTIGLNDLKYAVPGNTYHFIEVTSDGKTSRVVWDDQRRPPISDSVLVFHRRLMYLVRS
jgi:hypothetical protein